MTGKSFVLASDHDFAQRRETRIDALADLIDEHLDTAGITALLGDDALSSIPKVTLDLE